ncbi:hypothetical protein EV652_11659 [Kribbella steppae]|uniref:Uncharacterized protein n=1 Tax=Kribbella steppae TaxID=2512223 RepID=A0A4R2H128_9ACTN|nr:hypothetical protein [Kribbella steppae]TCO18038.1 hypothetical protein EV652_11659 [Kribbella steppae]
MTNWTKYGGILAAGVLSTGILTTGLASAQPTSSMAASGATCSIKVGSVTAGGDHRMQTFATDGAKVVDKIVAKDIYPDGQVRLSATVRFGAAEVGGDAHTGPVIMGSTMYDTSYLTPAGGGTVSQKQVTRVGPGWGVYRSLDRSTVVTATAQRDTEYSLHNDGTLYRRNVTYKNGVPSRQITGWQSGYRGVKAMTLISQTATYDTFLMTLTSGKLYTARLPLAGGHIIPGVVKQVRGSTWQGFESLVAAPCGPGTLLLGIDKDSGSGYLYHVGHANGTATAITSLGKAKGTFTDPVYFLWKNFAGQDLAGE